MLSLIDIALVVIALLTNGGIVLYFLHFVRHDNIEVGSLTAKYHALELLHGSTRNELQKREFQVYELDQRIKECQAELAELKEQLRSQRNMINRAEGRIAVYEQNEATLRDEIVQLRNQVQAEQAKFKFLERENAEIRQELWLSKHPNLGETPHPQP